MIAPRDVDRTEALVEVYLTEYRALKDEILNRSTSQQSLTAINVTALGAVFSYALTAGEYSVLLAVPIVASGLALLWLGHAFTIKEIVLYKARVLNPKICALLGDETGRMMEWEGRDKVLIGARTQRVWKAIYLFGMALAFVGGSLAAQVLSYLYAQRDLAHVAVWSANWILILLVAVGLSLWARGGRIGGMVSVGQLRQGDTEIIEALRQCDEEGPPVDSAGPEHSPKGSRRKRR